MDSPYTPPQSEDPVVIPRGTGRGVRITVRILGVMAFVAATALALALRTVASMARELRGVDGLPSGNLSAFLLGWGRILPFIVASLLAGTGVFLSSRHKARAWPMLILVLASLLLTVAFYFGMWILISELVRTTGGP